MSPTFSVYLAYPYSAVLKNFANPGSERRRTLSLIHGKGAKRCKHSE